jgi:7,8-dihydro-6-hydroxymethylpterin dimethyltransferase
VEGDRTMDDIEKRRGDRWNFLFIAGMWFQDLFNYDFRRTEMCIIPYATQQGEISFCAYNTGIGWRNIIEKMHMTATLTKWYEEHGRHEIFAGGKKVELASTAHSLKLNEEAVRAGAQTDLDDLGIAKNAREEKIAARKHSGEGTPEKKKSPEELAKEAAYNAEMAKLYAQHVLKEQPTLQIQGLGGKKKSIEPAEVLHKEVV